MTSLAQTPSRIDVSVIPGTSGIISSPSGIQMALTSESEISDWGTFELWSALYDMKTGVISDETETAVNVLFTITKADNQNLTHGTRGTFDIIWDRMGVRESIVRGLVTVNEPVYSDPVEEEDPDMEEEVPDA